MEAKGCWKFTRLLRIISYIYTLSYFMINWNIFNKYNFDKGTLRNAKNMKNVYVICFYPLTEKCVSESS